MLQIKANNSKEHTCSDAKDINCYLSIPDS